MILLLANQSNPKRQDRELQIASGLLIQSHISSISYKHLKGFTPLIRGSKR
jgi:hypothetical protein